MSWWWRFSDNRRNWKNFAKRVEGAAMRDCVGWSVERRKIILLLWGGWKPFLIENSWRGKIFQFSLEKKVSIYPHTRFSIVLQFLSSNPIISPPNRRQQQHGMNETRRRKDKSRTDRRRKKWAHKWRERRSEKLEKHFLCPDDEQRRRRGVKDSSGLLGWRFNSILRLHRRPNKIPERRIIFDL